MVSSLDSKVKDSRPNGRSGCTSVQILPEIAKVAKQVTVFQRTPNYIFPRLDQPVSPFMRNVYKYLPPIRWRKRAGQMDFREGFWDAVNDANSGNAQMIRDFHKQKLETELSSRPDLWEKLTPSYNPGCKRIIISDDYFPALALPHVTLETRPIDSISGDKIKVKDDDGNPTDVDSEFDLLVCATGFKTVSGVIQRALPRVSGVGLTIYQVDFMAPIKMYGKNGRSLDDVWKDGAQAYYGVCVEDMPNFGMLYGKRS